MNRHFRSQVRLSCDGKLTRNRANSNFHPQPAIVILAPIWYHSTLRTCGVVVVPMFRALIMIASVDRHGQVALRSEILCMLFSHLFDFFDISKCSHRFRLQARTDH